MHIQKLFTWSFPRIAWRGLSEVLRQSAGIEWMQQSVRSPTRAGSGADWVHQSRRNRASALRTYSTIRRGRTSIRGCLKLTQSAKLVYHFSTSVIRFFASHFVKIDIDHQRRNYRKMLLDETGKMLEMKWIRWHFNCSEESLMKTWRRHERMRKCKQIREGEANQWNWLIRLMKLNGVDGVRRQKWNTW